MSKNKHRIRQKQNRDSFKRKKNNRPLRKTFLIVCEGECTEPNYFNSFRVPKDICEIVGVGDNTLRLVEEAIARGKQGKYDQVWVVMDKDDFPIQNFNNALSKARANKIHVAYSNEAFELWYLLHFDYHHTASSRGSYKEWLTVRLGFKYKKNDPNIYDHLEEKQLIAIQNAKRLLSDYGKTHKPARDNPSTTVHLLVEALREVAV